MIAGIDEVEAVDTAGILRGVRSGQQETGIVAMRRKTGDAFVHHTAVLNGYGVPSHFRDPAAVKGGHFEIAGDVHEEAHAFMYLNGSVAGVA